MAVSSLLTKQQFVLDGVEDEYTFTFRALISAQEDIKCTVTTGGTDTVLVYTTNYTVAINSDGIGGIVTLVAPASVGLGTLTVYRETNLKQESDYDDYNQFPANTLEENLDQLMLIVQERAEELDRSVKLAITSTLTSSTLLLPTPVAGKALKWNDAADSLVNTDVDIDTAIAAALASQVAAATSATTAASHATTATQQATAAATSATTAQAAATTSTTAQGLSQAAATTSTTARDSSQAAATTSTTQADTATTQATAATTSATTAASHATTALTARDQAAAYAASAAGIPIATAGGTADAITADYATNMTLTDLAICAFVASTANITTTPTFAPDGLTARTIVKKGGVALLAGDIAGAGFVAIVEYNLANTRWELLNPALVAVPALDGIKFPATAVPSADANTLDDYEEGTWTPTLTRTGSNYAYTEQTGKYTKIGLVVTVSGYIQLGAITTQGTEYNMVGGLPFTASGAAFGVIGHNDAITTVVGHAVHVINNATSMYIILSTNTSSYVAVDFIANKFLTFTMTYFAT